MSTEKRRMITVQVYARATSWNHKLETAARPYLRQYLFDTNYPARVFAYRPRPIQYILRIQFARLVIVMTVLR